MICSIVELFDGDTPVFTISARPLSADAIGRDLLKKREGTHVVINHYNGLDPDGKPVRVEQRTIKRGE